jgi:hypothetical protein
MHVDIASDRIEGGCINELIANWRQLPSAPRARAGDGGPRLIGFIRSNILHALAP